MIAVLCAVQLKLAFTRRLIIGRKVSARGIRGTLVSEAPTGDCLTRNLVLGRRGILDAEGEEAKKRKINKKESESLPVLEVERFKGFMSSRRE